MSISEPNAEHIVVLQKYFGHSQFRPMQWQIIHNIIQEKRDQCAIMATGYGKSLCYQYPALYCKGLSIVISPLISLMQDQVFSLGVSNISACFLGSAQSNKLKLIDDILLGLYRIVYVTPEWCTSDNGIEILKNINNCVNVILIAIDEAHCVSQWGFDFRSSYRKLKVLKEVFKTVPILAVTATATPQVRNDICVSLNLNNPLITCTSFDRPNLYFSVSLKSNNVYDDLLCKILIKRGEFGYKLPGSTIIYCRTKKQTERVEEELKSNGIICASYHADLNLKRRQEVHEKFLRDELLVVVATVAFGMGIDKQNVRCIVHYGAPRDMESYYQEVGRAGRDGLPSVCHVFYSSSDFSNKYFLESKSAKLQEYKEQMARRMQQYLETKKCRRYILLSHFDQLVNLKPNIPKKNCCDNCTKCIDSGHSEYSETPDLNIVEEIQLFLKTIELFNGKFGMTVPIKFLRGMNDAKIPSNLKSNQLYGSGKEFSESAWKAIGKLCLREELLTEKVCNKSFSRRQSGYFPMSTIFITNRGKKFINCGKQCPDVKFELSREIEMLLRKSKKLVLEKNDKNNYWSDKLQEYNCNQSSSKEKEQQALLYNCFLRLRDRLVLEHQLQNPHTIATNKMLFDLAVTRPLDLADLAKIDGFNEARIIKFGASFVNEISKFTNSSQSYSTADNNSCNTKTDSECILADMLSSQFFNSVVDYKYIDTVSEVSECNSNFHEVNNLEKQKTKTEELEMKEDMWGDDDDSVFRNISLEQIIDSDVPVNCNTENMEVHGSKDSKTPLHENSIVNDFSSTKRKTSKFFSYDDDSDDENYKLKSSVNESNEEKECAVKNNPANIKKRALPSWIKETCNVEIKKKIKNNSLFKL